MSSIRASDLPDYAQRRGDPCFPPPYTVDKAGMDIFICEGDEASLTAMIERALNKPTERKFGTRERLRFELADRRVGFACIDVTRLRSPFGDQSQRRTPAGVAIKEIYARQTEVAVMVQVRDNHGLPFWYLPYVLNSLPTAITTGREIYGYPKQQAYFDRHVGDQEPDQANHDHADENTIFGTNKMWESLSVQAYDVGLPDEEGRAEFHRQEVLQFRRGRSESVAQVDEPKSRRAVPSDFEFYPDYRPRDHDRGDRPGGYGVLAEPSPAAVASPAEEFLLRIRSDVPYVFLRQFRDPQEPQRSSYQSLVLGRLIPDSADQLNVMIDHDYTVVMPWAFNLGLTEQVFGRVHAAAPKGQSPHPIEQPVVGLLSGCDATFKVLDATVLWEFGSNMASNDKRFDMLEHWLATYAGVVAGE